MRGEDDVASDGRACDALRGAMGTGQNSGRIAVVHSAGSEQANLAKQVDIGQPHPVDAPLRAGGDLLRCAPESDDMLQRGEALQQAALAQPHGERAGHDQRRAGLVAQLLLQDLGIEGVVQRERAAAQKPGHEGGAQAGKR